MNHLLHKLPFYFTKIILFIFFVKSVDQFKFFDTLAGFFSALLVAGYIILLNGKSSNSDICWQNKIIIYCHTLLPILIGTKILILEFSFTVYFTVTVLLLIISLMSIGKYFHIEPYQNSKIIVCGAYQYVRHPIYSINLQVIIITLLISDSYDFENSTLLLIYILLTIKRIEIEESFLSANSNYVNYRNKVRFKLFPFLI